MLHNFLENNRSDLIRRCSIKAAQRPERPATEHQLRNGIPMFLDQLIRTLEVEQTDHPLESRNISGPSGGGPVISEMSTSAAQHGKVLLSLGFTVDQVVHCYGDLCQSITDLAFERDAPFQVDEFRTLNRCLDNAIAEAVTEFSFQRDRVSEVKQAEEATLKLGYFAHELRNALGTATMAFAAAKTGNLPLTGATGTIIERSHNTLRVLIDRSLAEVRNASNAKQSASPFNVSAFVGELSAAGALAAKVKGCIFVVSEINDGLMVSGNRDLLFSAVWNLLQNAFKFTHPNSEVTLHAYASEDQLLIDVKDHCGGLAPGVKDRMFTPFSQHGSDKSGVGLGLPFAQDCIARDGGTLTVQDVPGIGCIFTVSLPLH